MAYEEMQPHGEERADLRAGIIASTMANAFRAKNSTAAKPRDFMPEFDHFVKPAKPGDLMRKLQLFTAMAGGKVQ